jgi:hypothetical protein
MVSWGFQIRESRKHQIAPKKNHLCIILTLGGTSKWSVRSIHSKNYVAIIHLLVALATHFRANVRLPEHVSVPVVVLSKENNRIKQVIYQNYIQSTIGSNGRIWTNFCILLFTRYLSSV